MNPYHRGAAQARTFMLLSAILGQSAHVISTEPDRPLIDDYREPVHPSEPSPEDLRRIEAAKLKRDRKALRKLKQST